MIFMLLQFTIFTLSSLLLKCEIKICTCIHIFSNVFRNFSLTVTAAKNDKSLNLVTKKLEKLSPKASFHFLEMNYGD